jgi:hypothetical protein
MSLTAEAYKQRKWGPYPSLRKALEDKRIPDHHYGLTSVADNMFDRMHRLMEIVTLVEEFEREIQETVISVGREEMCHDLMNLMDELKKASNFFEYNIEKVRKIYITL